MKREREKNPILVNVRGKTKLKNYTITWNTLFRKLIVQFLAVFVIEIYSGDGNKYDSAFRSIKATLMERAPTHAHTHKKLKKSNQMNECCEIKKENFK